MKKRKKLRYKTPVIIFFLILVLLSINASKFVIKEYDKTVWKDQGNLIVAILGKKNFLFVANQGQQKKYLIKFPKNSILQGENSQATSSLLAMSRFFAAPVYAFYQKDMGSSISFNPELSDFVHGKTNMSIFDYFKIKSFAFETVAIDIEKEVKFDDYYINGRIFKRFSAVDVDRAIKNIFTDSELTKDSIFFKIIYDESSKKDRLFYDRVISNIGWKLSDVEKVQNTIISNHSGKNQCLTKIKLKSLKSKIQNLFNCKILDDQSINYSVILRIT